jgi:general secretion pathway protein A
MYVPFFGLKREPFSIAPDPRYLFMSERHREALAHLLYGVKGGGGFVLLSGEIGAGKTTVCRCFLEQIPERCNVAYIFNPKLTVLELMSSVCEEFGLPSEQPEKPTITIKDYLDRINKFLLATHAVGQNNVLIIDEAQMLSADLLEQLRLLTNLETNERKLLQILLIGQPELRDMLARPELEQLAQRVIARFHLEALSETETGQYIRHRLLVSGLKIANPFNENATQRIHQITRGVPRRINLLCDRALLGAYSAGKNEVDINIVNQAAQEVFGQPTRGAARTATKRLTPSALSGSARASDSGNRSAGLVALLQMSRPALLWAAGAAMVLIGALLVGAWMLVTSSSRDKVRSPAVALTAPAAGGSANSSANASVSGSASAAPQVKKVVTGAVTSAASGVVSSAIPGAAADNPAANNARSAANALSINTPTTVSSTTELLTQMSPSGTTENDAWRALAAAWKSALPADGDPCTAAHNQQLECWDSANSNIGLLRLLDRPGILRLYGLNNAQDGSKPLNAPPSEKPVYALLTGLTDQTATLRIGGVNKTVTLGSLSRLWRGSFATFWRAPPGYSGQVVDANTGELSTWVSAKLASLSDPNQPVENRVAGGNAWRVKLSAFQISQGLKPDGLAGPTTFMQLNRATGVDEPRLRSEPLAR